MFLKLVYGPYPRKTPLGQGIASFDVKDFCPITVESSLKDWRFNIPSTNYF